MKTKQKKKIVVCLVGQICSGKGLGVSYLAKKHGAGVVMFSQSIRDILKRLALPVSRENTQKLSWTLRGGFGQDVFAVAVKEEILKINKQIIIVDGARRQSDITVLKKDFDFYLIYIEAEAKLRWQRLVKRKQNQNDAIISWPKFLQQEKKLEAEVTIAPLKKKATFVVTNNGTNQALYKQLEQIIKTILKNN